jgi:hypothetical protein
VPAAVGAALPPSRALQQRAQNGHAQEGGVKSIFVAGEQVELWGRNSVEVALMLALVRPVASRRLHARSAARKAGLAPPAPPALGLGGEAASIAYPPGWF